MITLRMAHRRTSRGQPEYLQFRPYRAIVASGDGRLDRRSVVRAFAGGMISWTLLTGVATTLVMIGLMGWSRGTVHVLHDLSTKALWLAVVAIAGGFLGGIVSASRK